VTAPLRLGLVGCGQLAELGYLPAIGRTAACDLVAVADPDPARRERIAVLAGDAGRGRPSSHSSATELVEATAVDAVVLASPAKVHLDDATVAVERDVAVLVEKPPAPDAEAAARLAALHGLVAIGFNRRFDPGLAALRASVPSHGDVHLELALHYRRRSWGARTVHDDALLDLGPHLVDLARWLPAAQIVEVEAADAGRDRAAVRLRLDRGTARLRAAADRWHRETFRVRDESGTVVAEHEVGGPVAAITGRLVPGPHPLVASLAGQLDAFARWVRGAAGPDLGSVADGVAVMTVIDAARGERPVPV
jgi:predicted dehydrogenase